MKITIIWARKFPGRSILDSIAYCAKLLLPLVTIRGSIFCREAKLFHLQVSEPLLNISALLA